ncbi:type II secretion system protein GspJ [Sphingomonas sp.]|uniref:type II secretion system protein GspJ n=1 Tax=Sphingomonas sp. TaxID=28214 RepID=UPI002CF31403|nr:type II secretion system protein GspJ [Sphingomonas sp.]HTG38437.1 type II secretion system protein GspJ [Sphingomonas sp.]
MTGTGPAMPDGSPADANPHGAQGGFTLIELMISLGLFALIAVAGLALVDSVLGVQTRTAARLDEQGALARAVYVLTSDVDQIARGRVVSNGQELIFTRAAPGLGGAPVEIRWMRSGDALVRMVDGRTQTAVTGVTGVSARFWDGGWQPGWPPSAERGEDWPRAVELTVALGPRGNVRRVIALPTRPEAGS